MLNLINILKITLSNYISVKFIVASEKILSPLAQTFNWTNVRDSSSLIYLAIERWNLFPNVQSGQQRQK